MPKEKKTWYCDCQQFCDKTGQKKKKEVSRATFHNHAQYCEEGNTESALQTPEQEQEYIQNERNPPQAQHIPFNDVYKNTDPPPPIPLIPPPTPAMTNSPDNILESPALDDPRPGNGEDHEPGSGAPPNPLDDSEAEAYSRIEAVKIAQEFIHALRGASLENCDLDPNSLTALLNPADSGLEVDPDKERILLLCLRPYQIKSQTQHGYTATINALKLAWPNKEFFSYEQIQQRAHKLSGLHPIVHDMCSNSCLGFTGPFAECGAPRNNAQTGKPQLFYTLPVGPQVQAMWRDPEMAEGMRSFYTRAKEALTEYERTSQLKEFDDISCGKDILDAVQDQQITETTTLLMISLDGCQVYRNKTPDCWIYVWLVLNLPVDKCYKKKCIIYGAVIPGPNKPKNPDSFLFPGLHHIKAINKGGGLMVWDAPRNIIFVSTLFILFATADGPGMVYFNGMVGHTGKNGCQFWCGLIGHHKEGASTYFPALAKPENFAVIGCSHDNVPYTANFPVDPERYQHAVQLIEKARRCSPDI
ncbi:hypothetical protein D9758_007159 [Tetrapyrgos nigripes]|uniref:Uncharacterized protein n=1 Tax=Tetrapyrgos nigripes TaxID=182062 RepID=A0A8H5D2J3_9AGAR|nr:hypothetical protein D9758_007159 [Tetrapyrgos nigripes]